VINTQSSFAVFFIGVFFSIASAGFAASPWYEEAKKEGMAVWYTSENIDEAKPFIDAFSKKYQGVRVVLNRQGTASLVTKIVAERRIGRRDNADVVSTTAEHLELMRKEVPDIFQKYTSPEHPPEPGGSYSAQYFTIRTIAYNTRFVLPDDVPRRWTDLLKERWKGKVAINLNTYQWIYAMLDFFGEQKGMEFLKRFAAQNPRPGRGTTLMAQQWLGGGEVEIAVPFNHDGIDRLRERGSPVDWTRLDDPNYATTNVIAILGMAQRPNAARLFVDFALSREGSDPS
jgi:iron(III) transport system substrate-binding protein